MPTTLVVQNVGPDGVRLDVVLSGIAVPLPMLKRVLREMKVTQGVLAVLAGMHQSTVSTHLNGVADMDPGLVAVLEDMFAGAGDLPSAFEEIEVPDHLIGSTWDDEEKEKEKVPASPALLRAFDTLLNEDTKKFILSSQESPGVGGPKMLSPFPLAEAQKVAEMVRKAKVKGEHRFPFSMRKLKLWGECFYLLQDAGFSEQEALSGGFHMAAEAKAIPGSEDRIFLLNVFESVFTCEHKIPRPNANSARADGNRHPMDFLAEPLIRAGIPTWLVGESATGKTWSAKDIAQRLGRGIMRVQGTRDTHEGDFVGGREVENATTYFSPGPLPVCMDQGRLLLVDEVSLIPSGALMALQAVLEGEPLVIKADRGRAVEPQEGFGIVVTDNTRGLGEGMEYIGTEVVNESLRDRFAMVEYSFMPPGQERTAVDFHLQELLRKNGWGTKG